MYKQRDYYKKTALLLSLLFITNSTVANTSLIESNPIGLWTTIDDNTGKAKSVVEITEKKGILTGTIIELLNPKSLNPICKKCKGDNMNKPILGLTIIWGVQKKGSAWKGKIIDPNNGKTYKVKLSTAKEGQHLKVRGYIGSPILGRTQTWLRKKPL